MLNLFQHLGCNFWRSRNKFGMAKVWFHIIIMQIFLVFLFSILAAALQLTLMPRLAILGVGPNLMLGWVLACAIWRSEQKKEWFIFLPVFVFDLLAGRPFGVMTLSLWLAFFGLEWLASILFKQNDFPAVISLVFVGTVFFEVCRFSLVNLLAIWRLSEPIRLSAFYFYAVLPLTFLYNAALVLFFIWGFNKINLFKNDGSFSMFK